MVVFLPWTGLQNGTCIFLAVLLIGSLFLPPLSIPSLNCMLSDILLSVLNCSVTNLLPNSFCSIFQWCQLLAHYNSFQHYYCVNFRLMVISTLKSFLVLWLRSSWPLLLQWSCPSHYISHCCQWANPKTGLHLLHNLSAMPYFWSPHNLPSDSLCLHSPTSPWPHA